MGCNAGPPTPRGLGLTPGQACADPALIPTPLRRAAVTSPVYRVRGPQRCAGLLWGRVCLPPSAPRTALACLGLGAEGCAPSARRRTGRVSGSPAVSRAPQDRPWLVWGGQSAGDRVEASRPWKGQVLSEAAGSKPWCREGPTLGEEASLPPLERMETCLTIGLPFSP